MRSPAEAERDRAHSKTALCELRPVYYREEQRICAHVILCWLGIGFIGVAKARVGRTWSRLSTLLQPVSLESFVGLQGSFWPRSEFSGERKRTFGGG